MGVFDKKMRAVKTATKVAREQPKNGKFKKENSKKKEKSIGKPGMLVMGKNVIKWLQMDPMKAIKKIMVLMRKILLSWLIITSIAGVNGHWNGLHGKWRHTDGTLANLTETAAVDRAGNEITFPTICGSGVVETVSCPPINIISGPEICYTNGSKVRVTFIACEKITRKRRETPGVVPATEKVADQIMGTTSRWIVENKYGAALGLGIVLAVLRVPSWLVMMAVVYTMYAVTGAGVSTISIENLSDRTHADVMLQVGDTTLLQGGGVVYSIALMNGKYAPTTSYRRLGMDCHVSKEESDWTCARGAGIHVNMRNEQNVTCEHALRPGGIFNGCLL